MWIEASVRWSKMEIREEMIINILKREDTRLLLRDVINYYLSDIKTWESVEERKVLIDMVRVLEGRV